MPFSYKKIALLLQNIQFQFPAGSLTNLLVSPWMPPKPIKRKWIQAQCAHESKEIWVGEGWSSFWGNKKSKDGRMDGLYMDNLNWMAKIHLLKNKWTLGGKWLENKKKLKNLRKKKSKKKIQNWRMAKFYVKISCKIQIIWKKFKKINSHESHPQ